MAPAAREAGARGSEPGAPDVLPRRFGRYVLFDRIGRGGMADIYLARAETEIGAARRVVVKEILPALSRDARFARMLIDEAKLVAGLSHANIAQVMDLGREGERLFITMEYVEGYDLNQLLRQLSSRRIALPAQFALFVVREVLAGLDFAHRRKDDEERPLGIVHRDVSPSNVLVSFEGEVKLCDFGIAKALGSPTPAAPGPGSSEDTGERSKVAGKAAYMSPEHARGDEVDARSDQFSAGIILYELCSGRRLYKGTEEEMLRMARAAEVPPLPEGRMPKQDSLQALLDRALARDAGARFATTAEMLRAVDDYAQQARLFASQLRFATFLSENFEADVVAVRRQRERAAEALEAAPPVAEPVAPELPTDPGGAPAGVLEAPAEQLAAATDASAAAAEARQDTLRTSAAPPPTAPLPTERAFDAVSPPAPIAARRGGAPWLALALGGVLLALAVLIALYVIAG